MLNNQSPLKINLQLNRVLRLHTLTIKNPKILYFFPVAGIPAHSPLNRLRVADNQTLPIMCTGTLKEMNYSGLGFINNHFTDRNFEVRRCIMCFLFVHCKTSQVRGNPGERDFDDQVFRHKGGEDGWVCVCGADIGPVEDARGNIEELITAHF